MKKILAFAFCAFIVLAAGACKSNPTGPSTESLVGTWNATKAEFTSVANSSTKVDIIPQGSTLTLAFTASTFTLTITDPGESAEVYSGTWSKSTDTLTLTWTSGASGEAQFDISMSGSNLMLSGGHMPHDFTVGNFEEAILNLVLVKQ